MLMPAEGLGRGYAKSTALKSASSEANSDLPYKEAYWYGRDTENRLANQLATGVAAVQGTDGHAPAQRVGLGSVS